MILQAIKSKNQGKVNRAVNWSIKYNTANDMRNEADGDGNEKMYNKYNTICEKAYDKYLDAMWHLPKYEQKHIEKSKFY